MPGSDTRTQAQNCLSLAFRRPSGVLIGAIRQVHGGYGKEGATVNVTAAEDLSGATHGRFIGLLATRMSLVLAAGTSTSYPPA